MDLSVPKVAGQYVLAFCFVAAEAGNIIVILVCPFTFLSWGLTVKSTVTLVAIHTTG
jgi:hypothetical protein